MYNMSAIFKMECKKALANRKNWFVLILFTGFLLTFVFLNMRNFADAREREARIFQQMVIRAESMAEGAWARSAYNPNHVLPQGLPQDMFISHMRSSTKMYHTFRRLAEYGRQMAVAIADNERETEQAIINNMYKAVIEMYTYRIAICLWGDGRPRNAFIRTRLGDVPVDHPLRLEYYLAKQSFSQHFVDNDILFLYESEMRGFNFTYQVMRQIFPLVMLFVVFMAVGDVFTSDNRTGSYKFLLVNPVPRWKVFIAKWLAACAIAMAIIFAPLVLMGLGVGIVNGFGPWNYPILTQAGAFSSFTPIPNNVWFDQRVGNFIGLFVYFFDLPVYFTHNGLAYAAAHPSMGLTPYSSPYIGYLYLFSHHHTLQHTPMVAVLAMALPIFLLLIVLAAATSALLAVILQRDVPTLILGLLLSLGVILFPAPIRNISVVARLNPFMYTNPINILNGLGSSTALTGVVVLAGWSVLFIAAGMLIFTRRDIRC